MKLFKRNTRDRQPPIITQANKVLGEIFINDFASIMTDRIADYKTIIIIGRNDSGKVETLTWGENDHAVIFGMLNMSINSISADGEIKNEL